MTPSKSSLNLRVLPSSRTNKVLVFLPKGDLQRRTYFWVRLAPSKRVQKRTARKLLKPLREPRIETPKKHDLFWKCFLDRRVR